MATATANTEVSTKAWKGRIEACHRERKKLADTWKTNVAYRKGKPFAAESEADRVSVPVDWSNTTAKLASLFSTVPTVRLTPKHPRYAAAVPVFAKELNEVLTRDCNIAAGMEESLCDVINASGVGAVKCGYSATFEDVEVPDRDISQFPPLVQRTMLQTGLVKMTTVKRPVSEKFYVNRISPTNLLWPVEFAGSDFDDAPWIGHEGVMTWAQAKREFGLKDADKEQICGADDDANTLRDDGATEQGDEHALVHYAEIFYKAHVFHPDEKYFAKIRRLVFVKGLDEKPVINEDLQWQEFDEETGRYIGVCKFPIRLLTLNYISDEAIPPSDSEIGRPQVDETMRSRSQMLLQRDRSQPIRWADVNRVDPMILDNLMRGEWQQVVPTNGPGERAIGEVARAMYPREDWEFDRVTKSDLMESWQLGPNQQGSFASGERSASEATIVQANFSTRVALQRAKVAKYFVGIAECVAGLMQLYYDKPNELPLVGEDGAQRIDQAWDRSKVSGAEFVFSIVPDSTVLLDSNQKVDRLMKFLNIAGKSGYVNPESIIAEIAALIGIDPAQVMTTPTPPPPQGPNLSFRNIEDLMNPLAIAILMKSGQAPGEQEIRAAKMLLQDAQAPLTAQPAQPAGPPQGSLPPPSEDWGPMPRVTKRVDELGG